MDVGPKINAALKRMRERYRNGEMSRDAVAAYVARARVLMQRHFYRRRQHLPTRVDHDRAAHDALDRLEAIVRSKKGTIMAFDTGFRMSARDRLEEFGLTVWVDEDLGTQTYVDEMILHRHPNAAERVMLHERQRYVASRFGETKRVPGWKIKQFAKTAAEHASLIIFHQSDTDRELLELDLRPDQVIDTAEIGRVWTGSRITPSLEWLCERYGIDAQGAHNSGNDSRFTMEVALAMLNDPSRAGLKRRNEIREQRKAAYHRMMLWPTRKPGYETAVAEWKALDRESGLVKTGNLGLRHPKSGRRARRVAKREERRRRSELIAQVTLP